MSLEIPKHIKVHEALGIKSQAQNDTRYVNTSGDTMTGNLEFPSTGFIMNSETKRFIVTMNDEGALLSTDISTNAGKMMGLLCLTYS